MDSFHCAPSHCFDTRPLACHKHRPQTDCAQATVVGRDATWSAPLLYSKIRNICAVFPAMELQNFYNDVCDPIRAWRVLVLLCEIKKTAEKQCFLKHVLFTSVHTKSARS